MTKQNGMILSIMNNFYGYPFDYTKYYTVNLRERDAKPIMDNLKNEEYKLSKYQISEVKEMYKILIKEIDDWEWSAVMDESREEYEEFLNGL